MAMWTLHIAGLRLGLEAPESALEELDEVYRDFEARGRAYASERSNPHLCFAGCSACCRKGAFFAVTLVEALRWAQAVADLHEPLRSAAQEEARSLFLAQRELFQRPGEAADVPGRREERRFSAQVSRVAKTGPACPLLDGDLCSVYEGRPLLCRAYGFPVDAYSVEDDSEIVFRSLCSLYAGKALQDYVRARDLRQRLGHLSRRLAGGRDVGRFTSAEAILARIETPASALD
jgi:Fe-S-cluster containining protein